MSIELFLYLADVVPRFGNLAFLIAMISGIASGMGLAMFVVEDQEVGKSVVKIALPIAILFVVVHVVIPSRQTMYLMAGASVAKEAVNSTTGQKVRQLVEQELDKLLEKK